MSWTMWHEEGLGFRTTNLSAETVYKFMEKHELDLSKHDYEWLCETREKIKSGTASIDSIDEEELLELTNSYTLAEIIADVIRKETEIRFDSVGRDEHGEECVIYFAGFPWSFTKKEMNLKGGSDIKKVLLPYMKELGIAEGEFGWQDLVFQG